jgi:hypothetical protein
VTIKPDVPTRPLSIEPPPKAPIASQAIIPQKTPDGVISEPATPLAPATPITEAVVPDLPVRTPNPDYCITASDVQAIKDAIGENNYVARERFEIKALIQEGYSLDDAIKLYAERRGLTISGPSITPPTPTKTVNTTMHETKPITLLTSSDELLAAWKKDPKTLPTPEVKRLTLTEESLKMLWQDRVSLKLQPNSEGIFSVYKIDTEYFLVPTGVINGNNTNSIRSLFTVPKNVNDNALLASLPESIKKLTTLSRNDDGTFSVIEPGIIEIT